MRELAFQFAEINNIPNNLNNEKKAAGYDWLWGFPSRNRELSLRATEATSAARAEGFQKSIHCLKNTISTLIACTPSMKLVLRMFPTYLQKTGSSRDKNKSGVFPRLSGDSW